MGKRGACEFMIPYCEWNYGFTVYDFGRCRRAGRFEMFDDSHGWMTGQPGSANKRFVS